jgi:hypothetical protein
MINYTIPTTIIDNFFDDPIWVRDFALLQEYAPAPGGIWPGERTKYLHELNPAFFDHVISRFLATFYDFQFHQLDWNAKGHFQRVSKIYDEGWVHRDTASITGIIYLDPNPVPESGTTIYKPKYPGTLELHTTKRNDSFEDTSKTQEISHLRKENNDQFEESIMVKNRFNRLVAFDSHLYHSANSYIGVGDTSRLTLVFFIIGVVTPNKLPLQRTKSR